MSDSKPYTSHFSLPYSPSTPLQTLDIHLPSPPPPPSSSPKYLIMYPPPPPIPFPTAPPLLTPTLAQTSYIHGGAFRDPLQTSLTILPTLSHLLPHPHIVAVASLNYRLCAHPGHVSDPSRPGEEGEREGRGAKWPDQLEDVRRGVGWLVSGEGGKRVWRADDDRGDGDEEVGYVLVGHSVGGTLAVMVAQQGGMPAGVGMPKAVGSVEGIYDFGVLRDEHLDKKEFYEAFITAAFGAEEDGGWERGNVLNGGEVREEVEMVVLGHSRKDELVEWGQMEKMRRVLEGQGEREGEGGRVRAVELVGKHADIWEAGGEMARVIRIAVEGLVGKARKQI